MPSTFEEVFCLATGPFESQLATPPGLLPKLRFKTRTRVQLKWVSFTELYFPGMMVVFVGFFYSLLPSKDTTYARICVGVHYIFWCPGLESYCLGEHKGVSICRVQQVER